MKTALGLAACACLALSLAAFAGKPEKPHYKWNGDPCTAEEIATRADLKVRPKRGEPRPIVFDCRTKTEWNLAAGAEIEQQNADSRDRMNRLGSLGYAYPYVRAPGGTGAGAVQSPPTSPPVFP